MSKDTQAFPMAIGAMSEFHEGMTLRDWFAGQAMNGMIPNVAWDYTSDICNSAAAKRCYAIADAMLREREAKGNQP